MNNISFEALEEKHRESVVKIFNYYVRTSTAAYRDKEVNNEFFDNFLDDTKKYPGYALLLNKNQIIGFCMLEAFMSIKTFDEVAEVMYFIDKNYVKMGIGKLILEKLESDAVALGVKKIIADIADDNEVSIKFHEKNGFCEYGRLKNIGKKNNKIFGLVYMVKEL